jgi:tetratricopeptide (TPR) repeat protein
VDAGPPVESVDLEARVVGEAVTSRRGGIRERLGAGVVLEGCAVLLGLGDARADVIEPRRGDAERAEHGADLVDLVRVPRGDQDLVHAGRLARLCACVLPALLAGHGARLRRRAENSPMPKNRSTRTRTARSTGGQSAKQLIDEAEALVRGGAVEQAIPKYRSAVGAAGTHPGVVQIRARLGLLLMRLGRNDEAADELGRVVAADPSVEHRYRLAQAHAFAGREREASEILEGVLRDEPDHAPSLARLAALHQYAGRGAEAIGLIDSAIERGLRGREIAHAFASVAIKHDRVADAIDLLRPHCADEGMPGDVRGELLFSLGRLLDALGDTDGAWDAYAEGNGLTKRPFDPDRHDRFIDGVIERFSPDALRGIASGGDEGRRALLVVGMPRSGTTLLEQVLAGHPSVSSGGELRALFDALAGFPGQKEEGVHPPLDRVRGGALSKARRAYLAALDGVSVDADRVTDKMPQNFIHLGYVPALLPGASVVHCRRDLRDTALSCFFRGFVAGNAFSTDLVWIARYARAYLRLMRHWARVLPEACPGVRYVEADYEGLTGAPETNARALVESVGLAWDDACLALGGLGGMVPTLEPDQAGRGVYASSVGRWRRYEERLAPFIDAMGGDVGG